MCIRDRYKTDVKLKKLTAALAERAQVIEFAQQGQQKLRMAAAVYPRRRRPHSVGIRGSSQPET